MKAASSAELVRPPGVGVNEPSPRGGSPRSASTFSIPASAKRERIVSMPSTVSPTMLRWAIVSIPNSCWMRVVTSTVPSRVEPAAP